MMNQGTGGSLCMPLELGLHPNAQHIQTVSCTCESTLTRFTNIICKFIMKANKIILTLLYDTSTGFCKAIE